MEFSFSILCGHMSQGTEENNRTGLKWNWESQNTRQTRYPTAEANFITDLKDKLFLFPWVLNDRLCGLVVRVPGYSSRGPGSIPGATRFSEK
jgi:hypothetical protein